ARQRAPALGLLLRLPLLPTPHGRPPAQLRQAPRSVLVLVPTDLPERSTHVVRLAQPRLTHDHRCLHRPARFRNHHRPALLQLSTGEGPRRKGTSLCPRQQRPTSPGTPTTSW